MMHVGFRPCRSRLQLVDNLSSSGCVEIARMGSREVIMRGFRVKGLGFMRLGNRLEVRL